MASVENRGYSTSSLKDTNTDGNGNDTLVTNPFSTQEANRSDITSAVNLAYKTIDTMAMWARNKTDSLFDTISNANVSTFYSNNYRMGIYMDRLMKMNDNEIGITLASLGTDAVFNGNSAAYTSSRLSPSYARERNYVDKFAKNVDAAEHNGLLTTRVQPSGTVNNYTNHNELYSATKNAYYDDDDSGDFVKDVKIDYADNLDSTLAKTKQLFRQKKINTIISRFHTSPTGPSSIGDKKSAYGLSRGRNLLTKKAESSGSGQSYPIHGYNNPYCRVWTHHYQYGEYEKTMRNFYSFSDDNREDSESVNAVKFHKWGTNFQNNKEVEVGREETWTYNADLAKELEVKSIMGRDYGWKDVNPGWQHSILAQKDDNAALVNITPKYLGGGPNNIHTKDCMFSIENLAWRGYDPYSFEQALSWEQRGPNGGRIMWFPPYGINFQENVTTRWNASTFIGRGEDVFTYVNTTRQGTLNFMLLVDHPSILDYVSWGEENDGKVSDTDLLRFFAGCDSGDANDKDSLVSKTRPTPLTDEYLQTTLDETIPVKEQEQKTPPAPDPKPIPDNEPINITFYVFYPNNYSGYYDTPGSTVEAMAYLLGGSGAQKQKTTGNTISNDSPISFEGMTSENVGRGYEMGTSNGISDNDGNYIVGNAISSTSKSSLWRYVNKYSPSTNKKWRYRIDGEYKKPSNEKEYEINTYDQTLAYSKNYMDNVSLGLNCNTNKIKGLFSEESENENLYSFAEIAAAITTKEETVRKAIIENAGGQINTEDERFTKLVAMLSEDGYKITDIKAQGYSNSHDYNGMKVKATPSIDDAGHLTITYGKGSTPINKLRNMNLAYYRAKSVIDWFSAVEGNKYNREDISKDYVIAESSAQVATVDKNSVDGQTAKKYRSAKVTITVSPESTTPLAETEQAVEDENGNKIEDNSRFVGWSPDGQTADGIELYVNTEEQDPAKKGKKWYYDEENECMVLYNPETRLTQRAKMIWMASGADNIKDESNVYRYDQEYHFFKMLSKKDPIVFDSLMKKIKYFDPAFHSMTPEGFNARLTFLQQCMRQGNTVSNSDVNGRSANNLAFGQQPYCVLRLGDFYNQMIVIENISFSYDPLVWDLNTEGIGVQPLICNVSMSFKFIGGGDMGGAVRRLQNAMSYNYYANTSLYDNRADRVSQKWDWKTNGALSQGEIEETGNYWYDTAMQK